MEVLTLFVLPALIGAGIGVLSGLLGVGGGTIMVPLFRLAFGMSPTASTATSLFAIIPTSVSGAVSHLRHKTCVPALGVAAGLGGALTSPIGVWLAQISPPWLVMAAAALIIGWSAAKMLGKAVKMGKGKPVAAGSACEAASVSKGSSSSRAACEPASLSADTPGAGSLSVSARMADPALEAVSPAPFEGCEETEPFARTQKNLTCECESVFPAQGDESCARESAQSAKGELGSSASRMRGGEPQGIASDAPVKLTRRQLLIGVGIGLVAGLASGYVGVGGGFIMVPLMLSLVGIAMRQASGTSLIAVMILAVPGVVEQALLGNIDYVAGIAVVAGSIPGAIVGARLVSVVPERMLRFVFGGFLLVAAALLVVNEFGIL
ncbi:sulfite exporter TauE/SafE family protein [Gordonibacter sp. An230]|uniref:sulfite exporter TauE/SafE family protein n=1 Tax=Gordonibacter sp. An230 TaxID=1965592 RepID=UPI001EF6867D|nr:sulfite exporter TauE/SafE family protein [Gordonibacter sp. An230]